MGFWRAKIERNRNRDLEEQRKLAEMGWHCITVWECQLKPSVREKTLEALAFTLNRIYLEDHSVVKRYKMPEEESAMAAEPERWEFWILNFEFWIVAYGDFELFS